MRSPDQAIWDLVQEWLSKAEPTTFAVDARYPPGAGPVMKHDAEKFLNIAQQVRERIRRLLNPYLQRGRPQGKLS